MDARAAEHLLVDGYNLIRASDELARRERVGLPAARRALELALARFCRRTGSRVTLFYDGDEAIGPLLDAPSSGGSVEVRFAHPPRSADDLMAEAIRQHHRSPRVRVVTSDREILRCADRHRLPSTPSSRFAAELLDPEPVAPSPASGPVPPEFDPDLVIDPGEVAEWEALFRRRPAE